MSLAARTIKTGALGVVMASVGFIALPAHADRGEKHFPLVIQNIHRSFLYVALAFLIILASDVYKAMWFVALSGQEKFGIGIGTIVLALNVILLGC